MKTFISYKLAARYCELHGIDKRLINKVAGQFILMII
jgi:hypothetical protein